jgi:hypothetical protein
MVATATATMATRRIHVAPSVPVVEITAPETSEPTASAP